MKKRFILGAAALMLTGVLASCGNAQLSTSENENNIGSPTLTPNQLNITNDMLETIQREAVSCVSLISSSNISLMSKTTDINPNEVISKVNGMLEKSITYEAVELDKEGYQAKFLMYCNDETYTMYISSTVKFEETETEDDEEEKVVKTTYHGVVSYSDSEYPFIVKNEVETDGDETESEVTMTITESKDRKIIIKRSFETEEGETEETFKYIVKTTDKSEREFLKVQRDVEDGVEEIKIIENGVMTKLEYYTKSDVSYVDIKTIDGKATFKIIDTENGTEYELV